MWPRTIERLQKLKTGWSIPPAALVAYSMIDAISNIDFVVEAVQKVELMPAWNKAIAFITSGGGNLTCAVTGTLWLGYLILRPERSQRVDSPVPPKTESRVQQQESRQHDVKRVVETDPNKSQIEISFVMGTGNQSVGAKFTNLTPLPITNCKYSVSNLQRWSDIQTTYLVRSTSFDPFYFPGSKTLEPESPAGFEIFSMRSGCLFFSGRRNNQNDNHNERAESGTTWTMVVSVSSDEKLINEKRVYVKVIGINELELVSDPEAAPDLMPRS